MSNIYSENYKTVAFYDSGIGGLTLLKRATIEIANVNFIYLGDNDNAPYGNKRKEQLKFLAKNNIRYLIDCGADIIVLACNTLTTVLLEEFRNDEFIKESGVIITGIVPITPSKGNKTVLLCTPQTAKSSLVKQRYKNSTVISLPFLAGEIDRFIFDKTKICFKRDFSKIPKSVQEIVLGCTHYVFLQNEFQKMFPFAIINNGEKEAIDDIKLALNCIKNTNIIKNKVTCNHLLKFACKTNLPSKRWIKFVKNNAKYNKMVYETILK